MTIVRSLGVTALVALMSAHRETTEQCCITNRPFDQTAIDAIEAHLRQTDDSQPAPSKPVPADSAG
jgi:hypothetical protein